MKKILVVEDDPNILLSIKIRLEAEQHEIVTAGDAEAAFEQAVREAPDLVLLDVSMPAGSGFDVAERIRGQAGHERVPLIFMTASRRPEFKRKASELGAVGFLEKPFTSAALFAAVQAGLEPALRAKPRDGGRLV